MNNKQVVASMVLFSGLVSGGAHAALSSNAVLSIDANSFFVMGGATTFVQAGFDGQYLTGTGGLALGTAQGAGEIDAAAWFVADNAQHSTTSPANLLSSSGNTATVDLSGWGMNIFSITIPLGADAWAGNADGVGNITCAVDCGDGDTYTLIYSATIPGGDPSNWGFVPYYLELHGTISAVPVPAAFWLFGSGLLGLIGASRRK